MLDRALDQEVDRKPSGHPSQNGLDLLFDLFRGRLRREALEDFAVLIDEELREIPLDAFRAEDPLLLAFKVSIKRMRLISIYIDFGEHGESDPVSE